MHPQRRHPTPQRTKICNSRLMELLSLYLNIAPDMPNAEQIRTLREACRLTEEEAFAHILAELVGVDPAGEDRQFFRTYLLPCLHAADPASFEEDLYFRTVQFPNRRCGAWEMKTETLRPYEAFVMGDPTVDADGKMLPSIGFFPKEYRYPAVLENGREWMTLLPNETLTTRPAIQRAKGRVLTYGLGLGYFAFHAAEKENVSSVTVVERSEDVISLFQKELLPQFPHEEKITIVQADAFDFAKEHMTFGAFDTVFTDIWHDAGDGVDLYLRMKEFEKNAPGTDFCYWIEDTLLCYLDRELWS